MKLALAILALLICGCNRPAIREQAEARTGGKVERGHDLIEDYGCASCHTIPGVHGANAQVGPPLEHIANRTYIGIGLTNTPENLKAWIQHPRDLAPQAAMPNLHINDSDARDISSYLYTLD